MRNFLTTIAGVFVALLLFFVVLPVLFLWSAAASSGPPAAATGTVLAIDLRGAVTDQPSAAPLAVLGGGGGVAITDLVRKLEAAERDRAVKGLFIRAPEFGLAPAHAEEIRQALIDFKAAGKFVVAHAQGFENPTITNYVAIAPADEIWMQPASDFGATGLAAETVFLGGLFERFGLQAQFEQFYEYKNFAETYTQRDYSPAFRESTSSLLTSVYNAALAGLAFDRKLSVEQIKLALDATPMSSEQAQTTKLIDRIGMPEDAAEAALERAGTDNPDRLVDLSAYSPPEPSGPLVAVVGGEGAIVTGSPQIDPLTGASGMGGDDVAGAIREATDDADVKAIVLRVSSPGGSPVASEQIWAAVARARANEKPVVVSMGAYAASGGYYVSANADRIFAMPSTITGSIGVVGGKVAVNETLNRYTGANIASLSVGGPNTTAYSAGAPFTNSQRAAFRDALARTYVSFTQKVAEGRKMPIEQVEAVARGRVWSGAQARRLKLVDQLGGLRVAVREAARLAGEDPSKGVRLRMYPAPMTQIEAAASLFGVTGQAAQGAGLLVALRDSGLADLVAEARALTGQGERAQLREPLRLH